MPRIVAEASLSLPIAARRPWTLIIAVLLVDAGLAVSGAWMLSRGLVDRSTDRSTGRSTNRPIGGPSGGPSGGSQESRPR